MDMDDKHREFFEIAARVLIRCFWGGVILLLAWFAAFVSAGEWIYVVSNAMLFGISLRQFELILFCAMAATKICVLLFFLIPYLCLKLVLQKNP